MTTIQHNQSTEYPSWQTAIRQAQAIEKVKREAEQAKREEEQAKFQRENGAKLRQALEFLDIHPGELTDNLWVSPDGFRFWLHDGRGGGVAFEQGAFTRNRAYKDGIWFILHVTKPSPVYEDAPYYMSTSVQGFQFNIEQERDDAERKAHEQILIADALDNIDARLAEIEAKYQKANGADTSPEDKLRDALIDFLGLPQEVF